LPNSCGLVGSGPCTASHCRPGGSRPVTCH
jgi:hypothetical protein